MQMLALPDSADDSGTASLVYVHLTRHRVPVIDEVNDVPKLWLKLGVLVFGEVWKHGNIVAQAHAFTQINH